MILRRYLDAQLELDARSLALGRVGLSLVVLFDLAQRATNLVAHYSDSGVLPRVLFHDPMLGFGWSLHALFGSPTFEGALFAIAAAAALALLLGWHTRVALFVVFVLTVSLHARNPYLRDGQDDWLRVALFWSLWLPLGRRFSLDARRTPNVENRVSGFYACGFFAQLVLIYASAAIGKLQSPWWVHGVGLERALQLDFYETTAGHWLLGTGGLLVALNFFVIATELVLPLLLFIPARRLRLWLVLAFIGFHLGMGIFLKLGTFPWVCMSTWFLFLPGNQGAPTFTPSNVAPSKISPALVALPFVLLSAIVVINTHLSRPLLQRQTDWLAQDLGLEQYWIVFSPRQPIFSGYLVAPAMRADGSQIDLFAGGEPVTWQRPPLVSSTFKDRRWRQFYRSFVTLTPSQTVVGAWKEKVRDATAEWFCRDYAEQHPDGPALEQVELYYVRHLLGKPEPVERALLVSRSCP